MRICIEKTAHSFYFYHWNDFSVLFQNIIVRKLTVLHKNEKYLGIKAKTGLLGECLFNGEHRPKIIIPHNNIC
jgi:hypothetical protein